MKNRGPVGLFTGFVALASLAGAWACGKEAPPSAVPSASGSAAASAASAAPAASTPSTAASAAVAPSAAPSASAVASASPPGSATAIAPPPPPATGPLSPKVSIKKLFPDDQEHEGWPDYEYADLPAVTEDGAKVAVVEERDGWGHTKAPGVRILDATGKSIAWFPTTPSGMPAPKSEAVMKTAEKALNDLLKKANDELAKGKWLPLRTGPVTTKGDAKSFVATMQIGVIAVRMTFQSQDDYDGKVPPTEISLRNAKTMSMTAIDSSNWLSTAKCATPSFSVVGLNEKAKVIVFHQHIGKTTHACDGVAVPHDWRVARF